MNFEEGTSSVPLDLVVGKALAGHWNLSHKGTAYPDWTSRLTRDDEAVFTIGHHLPALFSRR